MVGLLCDGYRAELQTDGSIWVVPEDYNKPMDTRTNIKSEALRVPWCRRSSPMSRREVAYLLPDLDSIGRWADLAPWLKHLSQPTSQHEENLEGEYEKQGSFCNLA